MLCCAFCTYFSEKTPRWMQDGVRDLKHFVEENTEHEKNLKHIKAISKLAAAASCPPQHLAKSAA